ncbi:MAG: PAS domain S-box protein [Fidelibacterota bacterium]
MTQAKRFILILAVVGTATIGISLAWNLIQNKSALVESARVQARMSFKKDILYRLWNAQQGGVYVPVSEHVPPNPYLSFIPDRDVETTDGKRLTLVNPAYMTRLVFELEKEKYGLRSHITSLKPVRPENKADVWETKALEAFETGEQEISSLENLEGKPYLRLMRPLITEKPCLRCHDRQGYKEGDIRGGISVAVPMDPLLAIYYQSRNKIIWIHLFLLIVGSGCLYLGFVWFEKSEKKRMETFRALEQSNYLIEEAQRIARLGSYFLNINTGFWTSSEILDEIFGIGPDYERSVEGWVKIAHPEEQEAMLKYFQEEVLGKKQPFDREYRIVRINDKEQRWVHGLGKLEFNDEAEPIRMVGTIQDITDRKNTQAELALAADRDKRQLAEIEASLEEARGAYQATVNLMEDLTREIESRKKIAEDLKTAQEYSQSLIDSSLDMIIAVNKQRKITEFNRAAEETFGYTKTEVLGKHINILYANEAEGRKVHRQTMEKGHLVQEILNRRKNGEIFPALLAASILTDDQGRIVGVMGVSRDITEQKQAEHERMILQRLTRRLTEPLDLHAIGQTVAQEAQALFHFDAFSLDVIETEKDLLVGIYNEDTREGSSTPEEVPAATIPLKDVKNRIPLDGETQLLNRDKLPDRENTNAFGFSDRLSRSLMYAPVIWESRTIGILSIQSYTVNKYTDRDLELLQTLANQLGGVFIRLKESEALQESEERFRGLVNTAPIGIAIHQEGKFVLVNDYMLKMTGYTREEIIGMPVLEILVPEQREQVWKRVQEMIRTGEPAPASEEHILTRDGQIIYAMVAGTPITYQGKPSVEVSAIDITEIKKVERARRESEQQYRSLVENSILGMAVYRPEKPYSFCNPRMAEITGYSVEELQSPGFDFICLFDPQDHKTIKMLTKKRLSGEKIDPYVMPITSKQGERKYVEINNIYFDFSGEPAVQMQYLEVTERYQALQALTESEEKFRRVIEQSNDGIYVLQGERFLFINPRFTDLVGYKLDEISDPDFDFMDLVAPEGQKVLEKRAADRARGKTPPTRYVFKGLRKDGLKRDFEVSVTEVEWENKAATLGILQDVTEREESRVALERAYEKAQEGERVKSLFLANMSHEIRTPLNTILGFTDLVEQSVGDRVAPDEREFFETIRNSGQRLMHTIHEILDMSQIEAKTFSVNLESLDLVVLMKMATEPLFSKAEKKGLTLKVHSAISLAPVEADEHCVVQAVGNVVDNAIKYTNEGRIDVELKAGNGEFLLQVRDTGIGIAREHQQKIFEVFTQESEGYNKEFQGVGLGLSLVKQYLNVCQATIELESEKGVGSKFTMHFQKLEQP